MSTPKGFKDLTKDELIRSAVEDFAIELSEEESANKKSVLAAFTESNLIWADYVSQHPEVAPEPEPVVSITSNAPSHGVIGEDTVTGVLSEVAAAPVDEVVEEIAVASNPDVPALPDKYLLKMTRENPLYQTRGYTFTDEHPYALTTAADAMWILENEEGFRQAYPQELAEFYG